MLYRAALLATMVCAACADGVVTGPAVSSRYSPPPQVAAVPSGAGAGTAPATAPPPGTRPVLTVSTVVWFALTDGERDTVRDRYDVNVSELANYAIILNVQGVDESTPGTIGGSALGGSLGSAMYVDSAFRGPSINYSATSHLGASLLGAVIGSSMDREAQRSFRFRYSVKDGAGNINQFDRVSSEPFHQPVGACVEVASLTIVASSYCAMDLSSFREQYLRPPATTAPTGGRKTIVEGKRS
ncbi:hypothetical protein [Azospirillum brasilense]|uniref:hypothetical protein n=1 Tax=Azospirillum brasilense TaxID=192 RepID=UPI0013B41205|nr:hypothetical protein [Azospirillum brasilense]